MSKHIYSRARSSARLMVAVVSIALTPALIHAQGFSGLFNTGVDATGTPLATGATDTHYQVVENGNSQAFVVFQPVYAVDASARYIWEQAGGGPTNVTRTFRTTFTITAGYDPLTAILNGKWSTDNTGLDIFLNGFASGNTSLGFGAYTPFSITSGFLAGLNTLDFRVRDEGTVAAFSATDLIGSARLSGPPTVVPEPSTVALMMAGLAGLGVVAHRRKRHA